MKPFTKNIVSIGRIVAFLFFVTSSGFTTMLHICSMQASECCDPSGASDHHACPNEEEKPAPVAGESIQGVDDCHVNTVVGGLSAIQALLEKDSKVQNDSNHAPLVSTFVSLVPSTSTSVVSYSSTENVTPPSVEKYVLNETFLI